IGPGAESWEVRLPLLHREPGAVSRDVEMKVIPVSEVGVGRQDVVKGAGSADIADEIAEEDALRIVVLDDRRRTTDLLAKLAVEVLFNVEQGAVVEGQRRQVRSQGVGVLALLGLAGRKARPFSVEVVDANAGDFVVAEQRDEIEPGQDEATIGHAEGRLLRTRVKLDAADGADDADRIGDAGGGADELDGDLARRELFFAGGGRKVRVAVGGASGEYGGLRERLFVGWRWVRQRRRQREQGREEKDRGTHGSFLCRATGASLEAGARADASPLGRSASTKCSTFPLGPGTRQGAS